MRTEDQINESIAFSQLLNDGFFLHHTAAQGNFHVRLFLLHAVKISTEELKNVDLDRVNVNCSPPDFEPQRQYYFMAKCRQIVKSESERLGRPLHACNQVFGCQMIS